MTTTGNCRRRGTTAPMRLNKSAAAALLAVLSVTHRLPGSDGFIAPFSRPTFRQNVATRNNFNNDKYLQSSRPTSLSSTTDDEIMDDETLLKTVDISYLQDLCSQLDLSTEGTSMELLMRLRTHADEQAKAERERKSKLFEEIESGVDKDGYPTKHKRVDDDEISFSFASESSSAGMDEEAEGAFYFELPGTKKPKSNVDSDAEVDPSTAEKARKQLDSALAKGIDPESAQEETFDFDNLPITIPPPPPDCVPNEKGERVVTVYSTKDDNDMTSMNTMNTESVMGDPGQEGMKGGYSRTGGGTVAPEDTLAGGPFGDNSGTQRRKADEQELDEAKEIVTELMQALLAMTGAPGFQDEFSQGLQPIQQDEDNQIKRSVTMKSEPQLEFIGFDPSVVPTDMLTTASRSLRAGKGQAFRDALSDFEVQAVGHDGMAGDDISKGGGHYREVRKVGAFLEGYRRAEVRRIARETATMLLDKLVKEGVKGLDLMLATTTKSGDDGGGESGELNDSLIEYLNEAIRQQQKKVDQLKGNERLTNPRPTEGSIKRSKLEDETSELWTKSMENGQVVESLDPNDPKVKEALQRELERAGEATTDISIPQTAPEQLLLLLSCLRDRVKAEAAFSTDEKGRNLRVLAYVLHAANDREREEIIVNELGSSLDRLDSFLELLSSAIDYTESTSNELRPGRQGPSPIMLKHIKELVEDINDRQAWKASGISSKGN